MSDIGKNPDHPDHPDRATAWPPCWLRVPVAPKWDRDEAIRLMFDVDSVVAESGASGFDPEIQAAAAECVEANRAKNMPGVMTTCERIRARVKQLADALAALSQARSEAPCRAT